MATVTYAVIFLICVASSFALPANVTAVESPSSNSTKSASDAKLSPPVDQVHISGVAFDDEALARENIIEDGPLPNLFAVLESILGETLLPSPRSARASAGQARDGPATAVPINLFADGVVQNFLPVFFEQLLPVFVRTMSNVFRNAGPMFLETLREANEEGQPPQAANGNLDLGSLMSNLLGGLYGLHPQPSRSPGHEGVTPTSTVPPTTSAPPSNILEGLLRMFQPQ